MQLIKKTFEGLLVAGIVFLLFLLAFEDKIHLPAWLQVIGRMHPMFLHFPITLLLVYVVIFWLPVDASSSSWVQVIGFIAAASAVVTAIMGLLLSMQEAFEGSTFQRHKWGGVCVALVACVLYYLYPYLISHRSAGRPLTIMSAVLVLLTGHWGGNLSHGENFLLEPYAGEKVIVPLGQAVSFTDVVQPVLQQKCGSCHSDGNSKGGLSVADTAGVLAGGKTGPFFAAGDVSNSLFIQRILLPAANKKHMAPASKPQLTEEEFQLLAAWVKAGAPMNKKIIDLPQQDSFRLLASRSLAPSETTEEAVYDFAAADEKLIRSLNNNYRVVTPVGQHSPALEVQFYGAKAYTAKSLEELLAIKQQIISLNLAKMPVTNDQMKTVAQMANLQTLNLNYTDISDTGIAYVSKLKNLREIALSGTPVTINSLEQLLRIQALQKLFVWNTSVDSNKIAALRKTYSKVKIETGFFDDGRDMMPLNPPVVQTAAGVYDSNLTVSLSHLLKGVEIRYTLDGREPDSVKSAVYKDPLRINRFTVIKAKAFKLKWYGSKTLTAAYFMKGLAPDSVSVVSDEGDNRGKGKLLFDHETGDMNVGSSKWLGFRKPVLCYIFFKEPVSIHDLALNMFVDVKFNMLLPEQVEVRAGMDRDNLKLLTTWKSGPPGKEGDAFQAQPAIAFKEAKVKCVEVVFKPKVIKKTDVQTFVSEMVLH